MCAPFMIAVFATGLIIEWQTDLLLVLAIVAGTATIYTIIYLVYRYGLNQNSEPAALPWMVMWAGASALAICLYFALLSPRAAPAIAASLLLGSLLIEAPLRALANRRTSTTS
jgi:hypothetical protein